jgi:hypothetical protein
MSDDPARPIVDAMVEAALTCDNEYAKAHRAHGGDPCTVRCHMYAFAADIFRRWEEPTVHPYDLSAAIKILRTGKPL